MLERNFKKYKKELNSFAKNVSKETPDTIHRELTRIDRMRIPKYEKQLVQGTIYKNLTPTKKRILASSFGNVNPTTMSQVTQQAQQQAQQQLQAFSQPTPTVTPQVRTPTVTQPVATPTVTPQVGTQPVATPQAGTQQVPMQTPQVPMSSGVPGGMRNLQQPVGPVSITSGGAQQVTSYQDAAGALSAAQYALSNAAKQLTMVSAAQNVSGFGRGVYYI